MVLRARTGGSSAEKHPPSPALTAGIPPLVCPLLLRLVPLHRRTRKPPGYYRCISNLRAFRGQSLHLPPLRAGRAAGIAPGPQDWVLGVGRPALGSWTPVWSLLLQFIKLLMGRGGTPWRCQAHVCGRDPLREWDGRPLPPSRGDRRGAAGPGSRGVGAAGPQKQSPGGLKR